MPGDVFWGIASQDGKKSFVTFGGFWNEKDNVPAPDYGNTSIEYRSTYFRSDDIVIDGFRASECYNKKGFGLGSGCDKVYFIRKLTKN